MKNVFVTGAGGFLGRRLIKHLVGKGVHTTALVLPTERSLFHAMPEVEIVEGDLMESDIIGAHLEGRQFDTLYHLAWAGVSTAHKNDATMQKNNIDFAFFVMELAKQFGCGRVIFTGSVSEYAYADMVIDGTQVPSPCDLYAATKAAVHIYCELCARQEQIGYNRVLIPSIYGPGRVDNNLITYTIKALLNGQKPSFTKLEQRWDYIYIDDVIQALYLVGEKGKTNKTYVAGYGKARPMHEYVTIIRDMIAPHAELGVGDLPYKTQRVDHSEVDISELQKDTGYVPEIDFETGIKRTISFFKENRDKV